MLGQKQMEGVLAASPNKRFEHFVKTVADRGEVWGLYSRGWALAGTDEGDRVFLLWPAPEYAERCAVGDWSGYVPRAIELGEFMDVLLPKLATERVLPGVFFVPSGSGLTPSVDQLLEALKSELSKY